MLAVFDCNTLKDMDYHLFLVPVSPAFMFPGCCRAGSVQFVCRQLPPAAFAGSQTDKSGEPYSKVASCEIKTMRELCLMQSSVRVSILHICFSGAVFLSCHVTKWVQQTLCHVL